MQLSHSPSAGLTRKQVRSIALQFACPSDPSRFLQLLYFGPRVSTARVGVPLSRSDRKPLRLRVCTIHLPGHQTATSESLIRTSSTNSGCSAAVAIPLRSAHYGAPAYDEHVLQDACQRVRILADVVVLGACSSNSEPDGTKLGTIRSIRRARSPQARAVVVGETYCTGSTAVGSLATSGQEVETAALNVRTGVILRS